MLALTPTAADAVEAIVTQPDAPDDAVLRVTTVTRHENGDGPTQDLQLSVVDSAEDGDTVVDGLAMAVDPQTATFLDDKVLDADVRDGQVTFSLYLQPEGGLPEDGSFSQ